MLLAAILVGWIVGDSVYRKVADAVPNPKWSRRHGRIPAAAQLEPVPIGTRRFETRYVQIQCNTGTHSQTFFPSAIRLWNTLPVDICQLYLRTVLRPISAVSVSFEHRTTSCFYRLHCIVFLSKVTVHCCTAFSIHLLVVRYSALIRHRYRKTQTDRQTDRRAIA